MSSLLVGRGAPALLALLCLAACSGGSSDSSLTKKRFSVESAAYGRLVDDGGIRRIVSPLSTVRTDPVAGTLIEGSLSPLADSVDLDTLISLGLGASYLPRVVPRNAVWVLAFSAPVDPASVVADVLADDGQVVEAGSIRVRYPPERPGAPARGVPVTLEVHGHRVWINPVTPTTVGFPASPVSFSPGGIPRADATGALKLILPETGRVVRSLDGRTHNGRADGLGHPDQPIGFNPGNAVLDFIAHDELIPTNETFNGFLPDLTAPRLVRTHQVQAVLSFDDGDTATSFSLTDIDAQFSDRARGGRGEWADAELTLRPGAADEERHLVDGNDATRLTVVGGFQRLPEDGDAYRLVRAEFFEPDPTRPIDPERFDADNPQNDANRSLVEFVEVFELDASGRAFGPARSLRDRIPAFSELRLRFNEPMDAESLRPWESLRVALLPDDGPRAEKVARIVLDPKQTEARIQPIRTAPAGEEDEVVGWGPGVQSLQLQVRTVPTVSDLQRALSVDHVRAFLDEGVLGITDLGGRPLGYPPSSIDPESPAFVWSNVMASDEALSSFTPPPASAAWSMMVHRFQGRPSTGTDSKTGRAGIFFKDQEFAYEPIADIDQSVEGRLAGSPVVFVTKVHDDVFPPPDGQFGAFPVGTSSPLMSFVTAADGAGPLPHQGARFQQLFRDADASPDSRNLAGTLLDLYRVSWAPIGGNVTTDVYDGISLYAGHSHIRPITAQNGAGAFRPNHGLSEMFDYQTFEDHYLGGVTVCPLTQIPDGPSHLPGPNNYLNVRPTGSWKVAQNNLYVLPFDPHAYHPWPEFDTPFQYNNGDIPAAEKRARREFNEKAGGTVWKEERKEQEDFDNRGGDSLLFEVRIQPQDTAISRQNGFTFSPGILITNFPMFRASSRGETGQPLFPDDIEGDIRAKCATANTGLGVRTWGDNSRYFAVFDYRKTTSRIRSPYARVFPSNAKGIQYFAPILDPPLDQAPAGTDIRLTWSGGDNGKGGNGTPYDEAISSADGRPNLSFEVTLVGDVTTLLAPQFDTLAVPVRTQ